MSLYEITVVLILVVWLTISIGYLLMNKRMAHSNYRTGLFGWLSAVQILFKKKELLYLFYRDMLADHSVTKWESVSSNNEWKPYQAIWFPARTIDECVRSMLDDLVHIVKKDQSELGRKKIKERFIYHALVHFLERYPKNATDLGSQFKIQDEENNGVFISEFYEE